MIKGQLLGIPNWLKNKIENNEKSITELNSKMEWEYLGRFTSTESLVIPSEYRELLIYAKYNNSIHGVFNILKEEHVGNSNSVYSTGHVSFIVQISLSSDKLIVTWGADKNGNNIMSSVECVAYYR